MNKIREVQRLNEAELSKVVPPNASWHTDYRDTAYIYIGGLPLDLSEGDVITIFSQYGEPVWVRMARDKETGKSKGFGWLKYEDQRSCDLAVDNLGGATVMGRLLAVDHTRYKKRDDDDDDEFNVGQDRRIAAVNAEADDTDQDEQDDAPPLQEELELANLMRDHDQDDPMKAYIIDQKKKDIAEAKKALVEAKSKKHHSRHGDHRHDHSTAHRSDQDRRHTSRRHRDSSSHDHRSHRHRDTSPRRDDRRHGRADEDYSTSSRPSRPDPSQGDRQQRHRDRRSSSSPPPTRSSRTLSPHRRR